MSVKVPYGRNKNMAASMDNRLRSMVFMEFLHEEEEDIALAYFNQFRNIGQLLEAAQKRETVPKEVDYKSVIGSMSVPENIDDSRVHYRLSRHLFDVILQDVCPLLLREGSGPFENVSPEKQLLVCLCSLANNQSMREGAHIFNLSKSTVHEIILRTINAILQLGTRVSMISTLVNMLLVRQPCY